MSFVDAKREAKRRIRATPTYERVITGIMFGLSIPFGLFIGIWQYLTPGGPTGTGDVMGDIVQSIIVGIVPPAFVTLLVAGFFLDELIGRERWVASLPRAALVLATDPEMYRR